MWAQTRSSSSATKRASASSGVVGRSSTVAPRSTVSAGGGQVAVGHGGVAGPRVGAGDEARQLGRGTLAGRRPGTLALGRQVVRHDDPVAAAAVVVGDRLRDGEAERAMEALGDVVERRGDRLDPDGSGGARDGEEARVEVGREPARGAGRVRRPRSGRTPCRPGRARRTRRGSPRASRRPRRRPGSWRRSGRGTAAAACRSSGGRPTSRRGRRRSGRGQPALRLGRSLTPPEVRVSGSVHESRKHRKKGVAGLQAPLHEGAGDDGLVAGGADADDAHGGAGALLEEVDVGAGVRRGGRRGCGRSLRSSDQPGRDS